MKNSGATPPISPVTPLVLDFNGSITQNSVTRTKPTFKYLSPLAQLPRGHQECPSRHKREEAIHHTPEPQTAQSNCINLFMSRGHKPPFTETVLTEWKFSTAGQEGHFEPIYWGNVMVICKAPRKQNTLPKAR